VPTTTEKEYPAFDDPFAKEPTSRNLAESGLSDSRARRFLPEENSYHYTNVIVHFDLKGAPPKTQYFLELLKLVAKSGATGILMEWEDMFPWSGELKMVRNSNAYTVEEVQQILQKARYSASADVWAYGMDFEVMKNCPKIARDDDPLSRVACRESNGISQYGIRRTLKLSVRDHERLPRKLKRQMRTHGRDCMYARSLKAAASGRVVCLGDQGAVNLIKQAIKQVVDVHLPYGIKHFHIGADEAFRSIENLAID
ncbi:hypothetical protein OSTOST_20256, partial [Ostertagia ostertagi]